MCLHQSPYPLVNYLPDGLTPPISLIVSTPVNLSTSDIFRETENKQFNLFSNQELVAPDLTFHDYNGLNKFGIEKVIEINNHPIPFFFE